MLVRLAHSKSPSGPVESPQAANRPVERPRVLSAPLPANRFVTLAKQAVPDKRHAAFDHSWVPPWSRVGVFRVDLRVVDLPVVGSLAVD